MTFRVFRAGYLSRPHERRQMNHLVSLLHKRFANLAEDVRLIIDFRVGYQVDSLIFKDGKFIILELKNIGGRIIADLLPGGTWKHVTDGEECALERSPFSQVGAQRFALIEYIWEHVLREEKPSDTYNPRFESFKRHFGGWVVTSSRADIRYVGREPQKVPWFATVTIDDVPRSLLFERGEGLLDSEEHFTRLIELIGAEERPWDEWILGAELVAVEEEVHPTKIPQLDFLLSSRNPEYVQRALRYISELGLGDYSIQVNVATSDPHASVRMLALDILIAWDDPNLGNTLAQFLSDESPNLRKKALDQLGERAFPEVIPEVTELLANEDMKEVIGALKALGITEHPDACRSVLEYANERSFFDEVDKTTPWFTLVETIGQLKCKKSAPWLMNLLIGLESVDPSERDDFTDMVQEQTILSLGKTGDSRALEPLLERARTYTNEWIITPIRALGDLGMPEAIETLLPFLEYDSNWVQNETVMALGKIDTEAVFDPLAEFYFEGHVVEDGVAVRLHVENALVSIDPRRIEKVLLKRIEDRELLNDVDSWRLVHLLWRVASDACVDIIFPYLKNRTFYLNAAETLAKVDSIELKERMMSLLKSGNAYERAASIFYMSQKRGKDLGNELRRFEKDTDRVVREVVADVYSYMDNITGRSSLLRMADDEDLVVQYTVYTAHIGESTHHLPLSWVCFGDEAHKVRYVLLTEGGILAWLDEEEKYPQDEQESKDQPRKLLFIEAKNIERAATVEITEEDLGLYVVTGTNAERGEYLIKPEDQFDIIDPDRELSTFLHEMMGVTHRDLGPPSLNEEETEAAKRLWSLTKTD